MIHSGTKFSIGQLFIMWSLQKMFDWSILSMRFFQNCFICQLFIMWFVQQKFIGQAFIMWFFLLKCLIGQVFIMWFEIENFIGEVFIMLCFFYRNVSLVRYWIKYHKNLDGHMVVRVILRYVYIYYSLSPFWVSEWVSEWVSDCCLTQTQQFFSYMYIIARTSYFSMRWWWCPLCSRSTRIVVFL